MAMNRQVRRRRLLAISITCGLLGVSLAAPAAVDQSKKKHAATTTHEQQLEARVNQLEQELAELKAMIQEQKQTTVQASQTAQAAQATAEATQTKVAALPPPAKSQFSTAPGVSVAFHGLLSATAFGENRRFGFGNGQNAEYPIAGKSGSLSGIDVRNTRFWFDMTGPQLGGGWSGGGHLEMDFFGGFNGTGPYARQQTTPRLRQAYIDLTNPENGSVVRIGQQWNLLTPLDNLPVSLAHIAFPLGFSTGILGWRYAGAVWMQDLNRGGDGPKWRLDVGAFDGNWSGPDNNTDFLSAGNADFRPQIEARLHVQGKGWLAYAVGHYATVDLRGTQGTAPTPIRDKLTSTAFELGGQWKPGPWTLKGQAYTGKALGQTFGALSQFGDIKEKGGFLQVSYNFTPVWSLNATAAVVKPNKDDVIRWLGYGSNGFVRNRQAALSLLYDATSFAFGLEVMHDKLDTNKGNGEETTDGNQINLSALYRF
ncbi:hypothetical protein ALSL_0015 [Aerosticca soli]|uniref:Porin n=2 Tax=Aerosticca soli TaxID=2010829 RepID=A0A2Z6E1S1_9GAMM|nr:hypothetical protein ALSL_0015 [Aerosticca soli]